MIPKQFYITEVQNSALKRRAKELGISQAEFVRRTLDNVLVKTKSENESNDTLQSIFDLMDEVAKNNPVPKGYKFNRQELYEEDERFKRWDKSNNKSTTY